MVQLGSFTAFLSEVALDDLRQVGGKGANLGHLLQSGFPVPDGFCVLARAYEAFIVDGDLAGRLRAALDGLDFSDLQGVERGAAGIRELITSTPIPAAVEEEVRAAYRRLVSSAAGAGLVAVRSSAGTKDLRLTSFPGQMDTYHNLRGEDAVLEKVRECWASLFSYSAVASRHARGIDHFDMFIAPVVQLMVAPRCAGVLFTSHPVEERPDCMVINSCFGLGEGVVSGGLACDHFVVDRDTAEVREESIGDKEFKIVLDAERGEGNRRVPLAGEERRRPSLTREEMEELVAKGREIEALYGVPQDIEWAFGRDGLFVLQSRPMAPPAAAPSPAPAAEERGCEFDSTVDPDYPYYTLSNISEVLPGVLTPLSISDIHSLDRGFVECNSRLGLMKGIDPRSEFTFLGIFYGRAHLNLSVYRAVVSKVPGATTKEFDRRPPEEIGEDEVEGWRPTPRGIISLPGIFARIIHQVATTPREARRQGRKYEGLLLQARQRDYESMPMREIFSILNGVLEDLYHVMAVHIAASQYAVTYFDLLRRATARWLGDDDGMLAARLVTGLQDIESAAPSFLIWDLSRMVKDSPLLAGIVAANRPEEIGALLADSPSPEAAAFLQRLRAFLDRFGYRGVFEAEAMVPNWEQDPSYVFALIRNYLDADPRFDPRELSRRQEREREKAIEEALGGMRGARRLLLCYLVRQSHIYISLREYVKSLIVKGLAHGKMVFRVVGRRLAEEGLLSRPDDVFFLTHPEVERLATGRGEGLEVEELVTRRRREYERNLTVVLPEYSRGRPRPLTLQELASREDVEVLAGIGVSPGRVTGRARVITDPLNNAEIAPGEILVAPVTDAAWTPLFVTASATVVDVGGPLSHGSIVAREFGIPCVVNVDKATALIRAGQLITVDGSLGKVYLHPAEK